MSYPKYHIASTRGEWLKIRMQGIGGSDVGAILGFHPFKTKYQLWLEKTGQIEAPDLSGKVAIQIGNELEDLVAKMFSQETGLRVKKDNKTYFHQEYPFLLANIDRKIVGQKALLECKTTSQFNAKEWQGDEVPASYLLQVQHYLNVLDYDTAYIAVIIGNSQFVWKEIKRDDNLIDHMTERLVSFWKENVLGGKMPEIDGSIATKEAIEVLYSGEFEAKAPLDSLHIRMVENYLEIKKREQQIRKEKIELENNLKVYIGQNDVNQVYSDQFNVSWKEYTRTMVDTKALKEKYPEIHQELTKQTTYKKFEVKENV